MGTVSVSRARSGCLVSDRKMNKYWADSRTGDGHPAKSQVSLSLDTHSFRI
jgi:hypothetical protein